MKAANIDLRGFLNSGTGKTTFAVNNTSFSSVNEIGVGDATQCGGSSCNARLDKTELSHITAGDFQIGILAKNITVDNVTSVDLANISGKMFFSALDSDGTVDFSGSASSFLNGLDIKANNGINVNESISLDSGNFVAVADNDNSGSGDFTLATSTSITSADDITLSGADIVENGTLLAGGTITRNGVQEQQSSSETSDTSQQQQSQSQQEQQQQQQGENAGQFFDSFSGTGNDQPLPVDNGQSSVGC